ncbi:hypothetical protein CASFOL_002990 [Castilleja foliolosa]|uniref:Uncharacterized protein n=1 Tax=Castilleja foliolosa TaxID=1961234 RepID=A0ABD3EGE7_9LAMI
MDEFEFRELLDLFPVVRSRDYHPESDSTSQLTRTARNEEVRRSGKMHGPKRIKEVQKVIEFVYTEAFWGKLKLAAEKKVGVADAEKFCKAFQQVYKKLVSVLNRK